MVRSWWKLLGLAAVAASGGCAGIYVQAGLTKLPSADYERTGFATKEVPPKGATDLNLGVGADFDFRRKARVGLGFELMAAHYNKGGTHATLGVVSANTDFNLVNMSEKWKLRGTAGLKVGTNTGWETIDHGGSSSGVTGGGLYAGLGFAYYATPSFGLHWTIAPMYQTIRAPSGRVGGFGVNSRLTAVYTFGDTRPDAVIHQPMSSNTNVMPAIAAGARDLLCTAEEMNNSSWAAVLIKCPDDKREIMALQTSDAVRITCEHSSEADCRLRVRELISATKQKLQ